MPLHTFKCANCQNGNTVDTGTGCNCHECEARRPVANYYRTVVNLIRFAALVATMGIAAGFGSCAIQNNLAFKKEVETIKATQEKDLIVGKMAEVNKEVELKRIELLKGMNLEGFDVDSKMQPDGRVLFTLIPKAKK